MVAKFSLLQRILLPTLFLFGLILGLISWFAPQIAQEITLATAQHDSVESIQRLKHLRSYYTAEILPKLEPKILPATFLHGFSDFLKAQKMETEVDLFSNRPFPARAERKLTPYQQEAANFFELRQGESYPNQGRIFARQVQKDGKAYLFTAIADTMPLQACADCHNSPGFPKPGPNLLWKVGDVRGTLSSLTSIEGQLQANRNKVVWIIVTFAVIGVVFALILTAILKRVTAPVGSMVKSIKGMEQGDLAQTIGYTERRSEVGEIARALAGFTSNLRQTLSGILGATDSLRQGASSLRQHTKEINASAQSVSSGAEETAVSARQANQSIAELVKSIQNLDATLKEVSRYVQSTSREAEQGLNTAAQAQENIQEIASSSREINKIMDVITGLASQTNLLALNAAIEAAKAGEFGKGFAVVADEVRNLAVRSNGSAEQIKNLIDHTAAKIEQGQGVVNLTGERLKEVIGSMGQINRHILAISESMGQQSGGVKDMGRVVDEIAKVAQSNAAASSQLYSALKQVDKTSNDFHLMAEKLKEQVGRFRV